MRDWRFIKRAVWLTPYEIATLGRPPEERHQLWHGPDYGGIPEKRPGLLVRLLGRLLRPIVWEAMRQHPCVDKGRQIGDPLLTVRDALTNRNRHLGFGP